MITFSISAMRGPMLLMVSGFLGEGGFGIGEGGFGNGSYFSRCAQHRYSQGFAELLRNCNAKQGHKSSGDG